MVTKFWLPFQWPRFLIAAGPYFDWCSIIEIWLQNDLLMKYESLQLIIKLTYMVKKL
jgi:hypothetical protein